MAFKIVSSQCSACGACEFECPNAAIRMKGTHSSSKPPNAPNAMATHRVAWASARSKTPSSKPEEATC